MAVIKQFTKLEDLSVVVTDISETGVREIEKALPGCRIQHNDGTTDPKAVNLDADRKAAEYVLSVGGKVRVGGGWRGRATSRRRRSCRRNRFD